MANEFKHVSVGTELTQSEYESTTGHAFNSQATGDIMYASSSTQLTRLGIGSTGAVLTVSGGIPAWDTTWSPTGDLIPASDDSYDLGSASAAWQDLFLEGDITLTDAGTISTSAGALSLTPASGSAIVLDTSTTLDGGVLTFTPSTDDTVVMTASTNGAFSLVTTDNAASAANIQITADGTVDIDSAGDLTLDSGAAINLEPALGSAILLDGTISIDAGVVTGATSITSTAFVGNLTGDVTGNVSGTAATVTGAAQSNITSLGTLTTLTVDNVIINGTTIGHTLDTDLLTLTSANLAVAGDIEVSGSVEVATIDYTDGDNAITIADGGGVTFAQSVTVTGDLTVNGTTTTVDTTNTVATDSLIELNNGASSNSNDLGIVMERGSTGDNAIIAWDESADGFIVGTTTATGASTGNLTITAAPFTAAAITGTTIDATTDFTIGTTVITDDTITFGGAASIDYTGNLYFTGTLATASNTNNYQVRFNEVDSNVVATADNTGTGASGYAFVAIDNETITPDTGSRTFTEASTLMVVGPPAAGTNMTLTNPYALNVVAGNSKFGGDVLIDDKIGWSGDANTYIHHSSADRIEFIANGSGVFSYRNDGTKAIQLSGATDLLMEDSTVAYIGDTQNGNMTTGLTINQGANDNEILAFKSSDVAHGITTQAETDTYYSVRKQAGATGGVEARIMTEGSIGFLSRSIATSEDTTDTSTSTAQTMFDSGTKSGTTIGNAGTTANIFMVRNNEIARMLLKGNGDMHITNTTLTALDGEDDIALVRAYQKESSNGIGIAMSKWDEGLKANREDLIRTGVWSSEGDFTIQQRMNDLLGGAIWQGWVHSQRLAERIDAIERKMLNASS